MAYAMLIINIKNNYNNLFILFVSDVIVMAPDSYKSSLQEMVYESLANLQISFERVDTDEAYY
ncbi:hypothetical protein [Lutispora sp.]|uniref:hypothetical protein n=1 Tax=Lutispora sp. TaxID=2828727 RepID=UPI002B20C6A4|nr:hypothetical protein [Lutispora sp.]MEA4961115.1 hypothetical protein [Lutispora sp.]